MMASEFRKHLRDDKGETLVETLCAIVVSVMAILMLTTAILASSNTNKMAETRYNQLQQDQIDAESNSDDTTKTGTATIDGASYSATFYGGSNLSSYTITVGGS